MIVWLASWPRSGNTFVRIVLNQCFGLESYSLYNDAYFTDRVEITTLVGHRPYEGEQDKFIKWAEEQARLIAIKTHGPPTDDAPAIYVIRHGLAASVSLQHYLRDISSLDLPLLDIVQGNAIFGSWAKHVSEWNALARPNTLLVRYEELVSDPLGKTIEKFEHFLKLQSKQKTVPLFQELSSLDQKVFRCGSNERSLSQVSPGIAAAFWRLQGKVAADMGYCLK
jgi:hypothetical protein